jgi:PAS domain S-box-containing protein
VVAPHDDEEASLRSVALQNAQSILLARQRAEEALIQAKSALEAKTRELAQSLAMMRATLESTTDGILALDGGYRITAFNQRFVDMLGIPRELLEVPDQQQWLRAASQQFAEPGLFLGRVADIYASAPPESFDLLELADGRVIERFSRSQYVDQCRQGRVWSFRDITERRRAEQALHDESRVLELLNETGPTLASTLDLHALVQAITDAATELSGAKCGAFFYKTAGQDGAAFDHRALSGSARAAFDRLDPRATPLFGPVFCGAPPIRCDDLSGDPRHGEWMAHAGVPEGQPALRSYLAVPVVSRSGDVLGALLFGHPDAGVFSGRTERLIVGIAAQAAVAMDNARLYAAAQGAAQEREMLLASERSARTEAERMSDMKDEFLATLSHELRTPLSAILGWSQILRRKVKCDADLNKGLDTIERNARVQAQLIEDLLDMSRITSGKVRLDVHVLAPVAMIEAALETVRPAADAKGIRLEASLDPATGPISGDPNRLQQVVWNLLSNAIKFTRSGGTVSIRLAQRETQVEISVADTGAGIKPEFLAHVFDRFRQADGSITRRYGGLGLGLSIVKSLVELHGGTVHATSAGEGQGATFAVQLPRLAAGPAACAAAPAAAAAALGAAAAFRPLDLSGLTVLVVDDEADARELVSRVLLDCKARVLAAASAGEALLLLERERPQVLVSDIGMPELDGYELLKRVRALGATLPAIALTAFARAEDRTRAMQAGFAVHLAKPVEPSELVATVARVAGRAGG